MKPARSRPMTGAERSALWRATKRTVALELPRALVERLRAAAQAAGHPGPAGLLAEKLPLIEERSRD